MTNARAAAMSEAARRLPGLLDDSQRQRALDGFPGRTSDRRRCRPDRSEPEAANLKIKCFDQAAHPYLAIGAVIATGLAGLENRLKLPRE